MKRFILPICLMVITTLSVIAVLQADDIGYYKKALKVEQAKNIQTHQEMCKCGQPDKQSRVDKYIYWSRNVSLVKKL